MSNDDPTGQAAASAAQVAMAGLTVGEAVVRARRDRRLADEQRLDAARRAEQQSERGLRRVERGPGQPEAGPSAAQGAADAQAARERRTGDELWQAARESAATPDDPTTAQVDEHLDGHQVSRSQAAAAATSDRRADSARAAAARAAQDYPRRPRPQARRTPAPTTAPRRSTPSPRRTR